MATQTKNLDAFISDDAEFRTWCAEIIDAITDMGLVQTSDTGQINTSTVARPSTSTFATGPAVFRFDDALQATLPVFIRVEFGIAGAADRPALAFTVGTSTNGANAISGQVGTRKTIISLTSKTDGAKLDSYFSGSTGRMCMVVNMDNAATGHAMIACVGRTIDANGDATAHGIVTYFHSSSSNGAWQVIPPTGSIPTAHGSMPAIAPNAGALSKYGTLVGVDFPVAYVGQPYAQDMMASYMHVDIGELVSFAMTHLGDAMNWMPMGDGINVSFLQGSPAGSAMAMRWD